MTGAEAPSGQPAALTRRPAPLRMLWITAAFGACFLSVRWGLRDAPLLWFAALHALLGGVALAVVAAAQRRRLPRSAGADGPRLLVAGSYHHDDPHPIDRANPQDGSPRRRNTAVAYLRGCPAPLSQDKHSPADRPVIEDIQPQGWPQIRIHVSGDGWHLVIAICRDLLNPHAVHAPTEAGVNLALVPAMSETLVAFGGPVANLVAAGQAFVAVANNPADFSDTTVVSDRRPARALFGHHGFGQQTRLVQPADGQPGMVLLRAQTGQIQWLGAAPAQQRPPPGGAPPLPAWAAHLARLSGPDHFLPDWHLTPVTLRPAAVLVLLTDGPTGPRVLLTERGPDLTRYPGQLVFPGGASETCDDGPVATALREAAEESGLDPGSVQILGTLPPLALPDSGFLVTAVLDWSPRPVFTTSANLVELSALTSISLPQWSQPDQLQQLAVVQGAPSVSQPAPLGAVTSVLIDLVTGMLFHAPNPDATTVVPGHDRVQA